MFADLSGFESVLNWRDGLDPVVARKYCWSARAPGAEGGTQRAQRTRGDTPTWIVHFACEREYPKSLDISS